MHRLAAIVVFICLFGSYSFGSESYDVSILRNQEGQIEVGNLSDSSFHEVDGLNLGYTKEVLWMKIVFDEEFDVAGKVLFFTKLMHDSLSIYFQDGNSWRSVTTGVGTLDTLYSKHSGYYIPFEDLKDAKELYIRSKSVYTQDLNFEVIDPQQMISNELQLRILYGVLIGAISIIMLYNLFLGASIKDSTYFYYALTCIASLASQLTLMGIFNEPVIARSIGQKQLLIPINVTSINVLGAIFCIKFLELSVYSRKARTIMLFGVYFNVLQFLVTYTLNDFGLFTPYRFVSVGALIFGITAVYSGYAAIKGGNRNAKFYLIAWGLFLLSIVLVAFKVLGLVPSNFFTNNFFWFASIVEMLFLSLALAARYKRWQIARYQAEKKVEFQQRDIERISQDNLRRLSFKTDLIGDLENVLKAKDSQKSLHRLILDYKLQVGAEKKQDQLNSKVDVINAAFKEKLKGRFPDLTSSEIEICGFIITELTDQEIATYRQTTPDAIKSARYRIRKKMNLEKDRKIQDLLKNL